MTRYIMAGLFAITLAAAILLGKQILDMNRELIVTNTTLMEYKHQYDLLQSQYKLSHAVLQQRNTKIEELRVSNELYEETLQRVLQEPDNKDWASTQLPDGVIKLLR